jgi:hypothetical protein
MKTVIIRLLERVLSKLRDRDLPAPPVAVYHARNINNRHILDEETRNATTKLLDALASNKHDFELLTSTLIRYGKYSEDFKQQFIEARNAVNGLIEQLSSLNAGADRLLRHPGA